MHNYREAQAEVTVPTLKINNTAAYPSRLFRYNTF